MTEKKPAVRRKAKRFFKWLSILGLMVLFGAVIPSTQAQTVNVTATTEATGTMGTLQLLFVFVALALAPSLLIMMTSFTRIVIVLSFLRNAIGLQQTPPNQVIVGLALFLSLFVMNPVLTQVNEQGFQPYLNGEITQEEALQNMEVPIKEFMLSQTKNDDLNMFAGLAMKNGDYQDVADPMEYGLEVVVPAFLTSELSRAFLMGFLLYLPFLVIDMIVASTLMSMGMVMLPPSMISLPFKLMLFVVVNGWSLLMETLVASFQ